MKIKDIQNYPITKELYELKSKGLTPTIKVRVGKGGNVTGARLCLSSLEYFFHNTLDKDKNDLKINRIDDEFGSIFEIPFDGWAVSGGLAQELQVTETK